MSETEQFIYNTAALFDDNATVNSFVFAADLPDRKPQQLVYCKECRFIRACRACYRCAHPHGLKQPDPEANTFCSFGEESMYAKQTD